MITHVAMLSLRDPADRAEAIERLRALRGRIPSLNSLRVGADSLGLAGCVDLVIITEHGDPAGLQEYQVHPAHEDFLSWARPRLSGRTVVDTDHLE